MVNITHRIPWTGPLAALCVVLAACAPKTDVSAAGNAPARYSHVFVTAQAVWLNTSATAGPDDTTWLKFPLAAPVTVDLISSSGGTLSPITTGLPVPVGTYLQARLFAVDSGNTLLSSAVALGALYNSEVDYVDSSGAHAVPLEFQNPEKGIGIATSFKVTGKTGNVFAASSNTGPGNSTNGIFNGMSANSGTAGTAGDITTGSSTTAAASATGIPGDTSTTTAGTTGTTGTTVSATTSLPPVTLAINVDGSRDLVPFAYSGIAGVLLNPHVSGFDSAAVGAIQGTLALSGLPNIGSGAASPFVSIQVTAESLSSDGTRHVAVNSTTVRSDGTFTLYPLSTSSTTPATYDLVIHGPAIATVVIKNVTVNAGDPSATTPVSVGTIAPRGAESFNVNLDTTTALPAGAFVGFYQTLPGSGEIPYLVEERPIDPFNRNFASAQALPAGTVDHGTFASTGSTISLTSGTPAEGVGTYRVCASAPGFAAGSLTTQIKAPLNSSSPVLVAVPALALPAGTASVSAGFVVTQSTPGRYNKGELIVSHDGAIIATAPLDAALSQAAGTALSITGIPGGSRSSSLDSALYYVSVRTWNSARPTTSLNREIYPSPLDLRRGSVTGYAVNID